MKDNQVFFKAAEIKRLNTQKRLFSSYEHFLYSEVLQGEELLVLDIGCNNGDKTKEKFDVPGVKAVIGLEYHKVLADHAQKKYGCEKFSFYRCNVDCEEFTDKLKAIMQDRGIVGFDIINLSLVLSHLTNPTKLLKCLKPFLSENGKIIILESDDSAVQIIPDREGLLPNVMKCLAVDSFAGDRTIATNMTDLLESAGYCDIAVTEVNIAATAAERQKKRDIYEVFFSYLLSDIKTLLKEEPDNGEYRECEIWLKRNKAKIKSTICKSSEKVSIGIKLFTACGGDRA